MSTDYKHAERWLEHFREVRGGIDSFSRIQAVNWGELEWLRRTHEEQYMWLLTRLTIYELVAISWVTLTLAVTQEVNVSVLQKVQQMVFEHVLAKTNDENFERVPGPHEQFVCEITVNEKCFRLFVMAETQSVFWLAQLQIGEAYAQIAKEEPDDLDKAVAAYLEDQ